MWWLAFIMSLITFITFLFVDVKPNWAANKYLWFLGLQNNNMTGGGMPGADPMMGGMEPMTGGGGMWGMPGADPMMSGMDPMMGGNSIWGASQVQERDLWTLIKTNFLLAMNDQVKSSDKWLIWWFIAFIIVSLLFIAYWINKLFGWLLQPAQWTISYLIYDAIVVAIWITVIFLTKIIYIDGLIAKYMWQRTEPNLKPAFTILFSYLAIAIVMYLILLAIKNHLFS